MQQVNHQAAQDLAAALENLVAAGSFTAGETVNAELRELQAAGSEDQIAFAVPVIAPAAQILDCNIYDPKLFYIDKDLLACLMPDGTVETQVTAAFDALGRLLDAQAVAHPTDCFALPNGYVVHMGFGNAGAMEHTGFTGLVWRTP